MDGPMGWLLAQLATADCEAAGSGLLEQNANAWSSLGYGVAGVYLLVAVSRHRLRQMALRPKGLTAVRSGAHPGPPDLRLSAHLLRPTALVMALALIAEGAGSVLFHGAPGPVPQALHDAALLALLGCMAGWHLGRAVTSCTSTSDRLAVGGAAAGAAAGTALHLLGAEATTALAAALVATVAGAEVIARHRGAAPVWTPALLALAATAALLWVLGRGDSPLCDPGSLAQAHAVWHVASAVALVAWTERTTWLPAPHRHSADQGPTALRSRPLTAQDGRT
jgi:hypothetical protein